MDSVLTVMMNLRYARIFEQGRVEYENIYFYFVFIVMNWNVEPNF